MGVWSRFIGRPGKQNTDISYYNYTSSVRNLPDPENTSSGIGVEGETVTHHFLNFGISQSVGLNVKISDHISTGILFPIDIYYGSLIKTDWLFEPDDTFNFTESLYLMLNIKF